MAGIHGGKFDRCQRKYRQKRLYEIYHPIKSKLCIHCKVRRIGRYHHMYCDRCWEEKEIIKENDKAKKVYSL